MFACVQSARAGCILKKSHLEVLSRAAETFTIIARSEPACPVDSVWEKIYVVQAPEKDAANARQMSGITAQNIVAGKWSMPVEVNVSQSCLDLLNAIFTREAQVSISVAIVYTS